MGRTLTTPIDQPDLGSQCIDGIRFEIPHSWDGSSMVLLKNAIYVTFNLTNYDTTGGVMSRETHTVKFNDWPASFVTEANTLYSMIESWAEGQGIIQGVGTTESI